jgi:hypothetical protein
MTARTTIAAVILCVLPAVVSADINITPTAMEIAFGPIDVRGTAPQQKTAAVLVRSSAPWSLTATLEAAPGIELVDLMREQIEVKWSRSDWLPMMAGVPVIVAAGDATSDAGVLSAMEFRVKPVGNGSPGERRFQVRFASPGGTTGPAVWLTYEILPVTELVADPRPFESPAVNPARPGLYPYDRHRYIIRSNVPWTVEVTVTELRSRGSSIALPPNTLVVVGKGGEILPILAGQRLTVEAGGRTTREGLPVEIQLAIRIDDAALVGGDYTADIKVSAHPTVRE